MTRPRTARRALVAGLATLSLGLAACGDDDGDSADVTVDEPADAMAGEPTDNTTPGSTAADEPAGTDADLEAYVQEATIQFDFEDTDRSECAARGILEPVGIDAIRATGLSPEEFFETNSLEDAGVVVTDDVRAAMVDQVAECDGLVDELIASEFADDEAAAACIRDILDPRAVAELAVAGISDGTPSPEAMAVLEEADACITATDTTDA